MKIKMTSQAFTPMGVFEKGQILTDKQYSQAFLNHLVDGAGAAERMNYETKIDAEVEVKKKPRSSPSSPPDKASPRKTRKRRTARHKP